MPARRAICCFSPKGEVITLTEASPASDPHSVITEMAELLAQYKLVLFLGAGISRQHLGLAAAELAHDMAEEIGSSLAGRPDPTIPEQMAELAATATGWSLQPYPRSICPLRPLHYWMDGAGPSPTASENLRIRSSANMSRYRRTAKVRLWPPSSSAGRDRAARGPRVIPPFHHSLPSLGEISSFMTSWAICWQDCPKGPSRPKE